MLGSQSTNNTVREILTIFFSWIHIILSTLNYVDRKYPFKSSLSRKDFDKFLK